MSCTSCSSPSPVSACQACPTTMGGKPVFEIDSKTVISFRSPFKHKKMCDGPTFTLGSICVYSCTFCYVISIILKQAAIQGIKRAAALLGKNLEEVVIRRRKALKTLVTQLTVEKPPDVILKRKMVIYTSPLVDAAANMVLVKETAEACKIIFELTNWDVRVLSKSNLLPKLAELIPEKHKHRMIYGVSTGTLDEDLCACIEQGTPKISKRLKSLYWLQDYGYRTFGMACPILPQEDYDSYARRMVETLRIDKCEHIWVEVINLRGDSFTATCEALNEGGFPAEAKRLSDVCGEGSKPAWEQYARDVFESFAQHIPPEKLRFLQYADPANAAW